MSELKETLCQCYDAILDPSGLNIQTATVNLEQIYKNPETLPFLIQIINNSTNQNYQRQSVIGIGRWLHFCWKQYENHQPLFNELLTLFNHSSLFIRNNISFYLSQFVTSDTIEELFPLIIEFIQRVFSTNNNFVIISTLSFLNSIHSSISSTISNFKQLLDILQFFLQHENILIRENSLILYLSLIQDSEDERVSQLLFDALSLIPQLLSIKSQEKKLPIVSCLIHLVENSATFLDIPTILQTCLTIITNNSICSEYRLQFHSLSDSIIECNSFSLSESEFINPILQAYMQLNYEIFEDDEFQVWDFNLFEIFSTSFCNSISLYWDAILLLFSKPEPPAKFAALSLILYSLNNSSFFSDKCQLISQYLLSCLIDESIRVTTTAMCTISEFCSITYDSNTLQFLFNNILNPDNQFLTKFNCSYIIDILQKLLANLTETDSIFKTAFVFLESLIGISDIGTREKVFSCLSSLVLNSKIVHIEEFEQLIRQMIEIIPHNEEILLPFIDSAFAILGRICELYSCRFSEIATPFRDALLQNILSSNSSYEAINAYGILAKTFPVLTQESVENVMNNLLQVSNQLLSSKIGDSFEDIIQSLDEDQDEEFGFQSDIDRTAISFKTSCLLVSIYPHLLMPQFQNIIQILEKQLNEVSGKNSTSAMEGAYLIALAFQSPFFSQAQDTSTFLPPIRTLVDILVKAIKNSSDPETAGYGFRALSELISLKFCSISQFFDENLVIKFVQIIKQTFTGEFFFQRGVCSYQPILLNNAVDFLSNIIIILPNSNTILQEFKDLFVNMSTQPINTKMAEISLKFGEILIQTPNINFEGKSELIQHFSQVAMPILASHDNSSISAISFFTTKFTLGKTEEQWNIQEIFQILIQNINSDSVSPELREKSMTAIENFFIYLSPSNLSNFLQFSSSIMPNFSVSEILHFIPPIFEVRKIQQHHDLIVGVQFCFWALNAFSGDKNIINEIAKKLLQILSIPNQDLKNYGLIRNFDIFMHIKDCINSIFGERAQQFIQDFCNNDTSMLQNIQMNLFG